MLMDNTENLSSFSDWQRFLNGLHPSSVGAAWSEARENRLRPFFNINFQSAIIDRLFGIAHMSVLATEDQRQSALKFAESIVSGVQEQFAGQPDILAHFNSAISNARDFYGVYGNPVAREMFYERGFYDGWGAELEPRKVKNDPPGSTQPPPP